MIAFEGHLIDDHFTATLPPGRGQGEWTVKVWNSLTNKTAEIKMTTSEVGAMMALAAGIGEDEKQHPEGVVAYLYSLIQPKMDLLGEGFRIIP